MNGSLFFSKVDETHTGSYTCTPYNELGTDGPSPIIHVIVLRPPIFTQRPKQIYIHKLGEDVHFTCEAADRDGHHHPTVSWARVSYFFTFCFSRMRFIFWFMDAHFHERFQLTVGGTTDSLLPVYVKYRYHWYRSFMDLTLFFTVKKFLDLTIFFLQNEGKFSFSF